jgi:hypothetical protein
VSFNFTNNGDGFKNTIHAHRYNYISSTRNDVSCPKFIKQEASNVKGVSKFSDRLSPNNDCYYLEDDKVSHPSHKETNTNLRKAKILLGILSDSTATEVHDSCSYYGGRKIPLTDERRLVRVDSSQSAAKLSPRLTANSRYHDSVQAKSKSFHSRRGSASINKEEKNSRHSDAAQIKSKSIHCMDNAMRGGSVSFHMDEKVDTQELKSRLKIPLTDKTRRIICVDSSQLSTVDVDLSPRTTATNIQELKSGLKIPLTDKTRRSSMLTHHNCQMMICHQHQGPLPQTFLSFLVKDHNSKLTRRLIRVNSSQSTISATLTEE